MIFDDCNADSRIEFVTLAYVFKSFEALYLIPSIKKFVIEASTIYPLLLLTSNDFFRIVSINGTKQNEGGGKNTVSITV
ncbi:MAG: hypothetical protein J0H55_11360 [Chitinophagaceae bacterium]|nr:hypothetical protein [Chitinophagaceae bacterium]